MTYAKSFFVAAAAAVALFGVPMSAQSTHRDTGFVTKAAEGGMAEVQMAQLAQSKGQHQAVKDLANRLYADHTKAGEELKSIAMKDGVTWPSAMNLKQQREYNKLQ